MTRRPASSAALALVFAAAVVAVPADDAHAASDLRIETVGEYFDGLGDRFDPAAAEGTTAIIQWQISGEGGGSWYAVVNQGRLRVREGDYDDPALTIRVGAADYVDILNGDANGRLVFASGRGQVEGPIGLAIKLERIFPLDR